MAPGAKAPARMRLDSGQRIAARSQGARTTRRPHYDSQLYRVVCRVGERIAPTRTPEHVYSRELMGLEQ